MAEEQAPVCNWHPDISCQFMKADPPPRLTKFKDTLYCPQHMPLQAPDRRPVNIQKLIDNAHAQSLYDFTGVQVVSNNYTFHQPHHNGRWILRHCVVSENTQFTIHGSADIGYARFLGPATIVVEMVSADALVGQHPEFLDVARFVLANARSAIDLSGADFGADTILTLAAGPASITFVGCEFTKAPELSLHVPAAWPQDCTFIGSTFRDSAEPRSDEARYRALRILFSENRSRDMEGMFYALEKRALRRSLPRGPGHWIARAFSKLYELTSSYGQSFDRAIGWFLGLQVFFGLGYYFGAGRAGLSWRIDWQAVAFTIAQVARPFEAFSSRAQTWPGLGIIPDPPGWWAFATVVHSVLSISVLALFLLALRWRFRRE